MLKVLPLLCLLALCHSHPGKREDEDFDAVLEQVFGPVATQPKAHSNVDRKTDSSRYRRDGDDSDVPKCTTKGGKEGKCVAYYLCQESSDSTVKDGVGVIDISSGEWSCSSYIDICCESENITVVPVPVKEPGKL